jgi:NAD(P)-dependent dehydrogenase (short-subunit alcohol dehydrogenase family)
MSTNSRYYNAWVNQNGPGDSRPTAIQIIKDEDLEGKLKDKLAVVTGASAGIGVETVRALHFAGATVIAIGRNAQKLDIAVKDIQTSAPGNDAKIIPVIIDQESLDSVREGAKIILNRSGGKINLLINNAGIMAAPEGKTVDGYEKQFAVNHLSHFLLFQLLKPALFAASSPEFHSVSLPVLLTKDSALKITIESCQHLFDRTSLFNSSVA